MGTEIERKFLLKNDDWRAGARGERFRQGYLSSHKDRTVRVRIAGATATLTIKGPPTGITRAEFEYPVPLPDAAVMLDQLCEHPLIDKVRYVVEYDGTRWDIDEFGGENAGLVVAEVELEREDQPFVRPPWLGAEVTDDPRYQNSNLARAPFSTWGQGARG
jgi:adenylate cyclase